MKVPGKEYFTGNEVLLMGYSGKPGHFTKDIYREMIKSGLSVVPYNPRKKGGYDVDVVNDLSAIKKMPKTAFVYMKKENTRKAVDSLAGKGVEKVLFQNKKCVDSEILELCKSHGMEPMVACPMMMVSNGFPHNLHRFFANLGK